MKKLLAMLLVTTLCLSAGILSVPASAAASKGTLNIYTWAGLLDPDVLADFEKETGYTVNYANFDYDETMLSKLEAAKGGDYDVVIADDYIIELVIQEGLAQKLNKDKLPNFGNINPLYQGQFYDPTDEYTIPLGAGVQTIAYNPAAGTEPVSGYADLWSEAFRDNLGITSNYRVMIGMALKILGYSYNTNDLKELEEAGKLLKELAPNIRLIKDDNLQDDLISGEVSAAVMYTSQVTMAKLADPSIEVVYPTEGLGFGIMAAFIPSQAPNAEAAYAFAEYILRPEIAARLFEYMGYYSTNKAADEVIPDEYQEFLVLPGEFRLEDMEMIQNISNEAAEKQAEIWTEFKSLCGQS